MIFSRVGLRFCSIRFGSRLSDCDLKNIRDDIKKRVRTTPAETWMPNFSFDFIEDCMYEQTVRNIDNIDNFTEVHLVPEAQWSPCKAPQLIPFREGGAVDAHDLFNSFIEEINWTDDRVWALHRGSPERKYVKIATFGHFPHSLQPPGAENGSEEASILVDPDDKSPRILIQLSEHVPPLLWLPLRPKWLAIQKLTEEISSRMRNYQQRSAPYWERRMQAGERAMLMDEFKEIRDHADSEKRDYKEDPILWELVMNVIAVHSKTSNGGLIPGSPTRSTTLYLGPWACGDVVWESIWKANPFVHSWPAYRSFVGGTLIAETVKRKYTPGCEAAPRDFSVWITKYSKSTLVVHHRSDMSYLGQMNWAEGCSITSRNLDTETLNQIRVETYPTFDRSKPHPDVARYQQFVTIYYPEDMQMLSGGGALIKRYNESMESDIPTDMPLDVVAALMFWRNHGEEKMMNAFEQFEIQTRGLPVESHTEARRTLINPFTLMGCSLAMLGVVKSKSLESLWERLIGHPSPAIRWGVGKSAQIAGRMDIIRRVWVVEKDAVLATALNYLTNSYLARLVGSRKDAWLREEGIQQWLSFLDVKEGVPIIASPEPNQHKGILMSAATDEQITPKGDVTNSTSVQKSSWTRSESVDPKVLARRRRRDRNLSRQRALGQLPEDLRKGKQLIRRPVREE